MLTGLTRKGRFTVPPHGLSECGTDSPQSFYYEVVVKVNSLDRRGFVIDQIVIRDYFREWEQTAVCPLPSCEALARAALYDIAEEVGYERLAAMSVTIGAINDKGEVPASVTTYYGDW